MPVYIVTRKADGAEVARYAAAQVVPGAHPLAEFDHAELVEGAVPTYSGPWRITKLAFRQRFTAAEKAGMEIAGLDNPGAAMAQRQMAAALRASMADLMASTFVDLQRADTRAGVQQLEALGLLAKGRAAVILDTVPTEVEVFHG